MRYRSDIDGLRTVAVTPVVLFHAGLTALGGGYVGVDVFFVISGFLITGILARDLELNRFSIVNFYERRIRRILPALLGMLAFVALGVSLLYLPGDFKPVPASAIAALLSFSNILFYRQSGYFDAPSQLKPLLHTWSLAVEEQFYVVFPILLALLYRKARPRLAQILMVLFALSFAASAWLAFRSPGLAFYWAHLRAWELLAGSLIALNAIPVPRHHAVREAIAAAGLGAIAFSIFLYSESTPFPGLAAAPPVFGAMAIILCAPGTWTGRLLSLRPMVFIGLISYSLYLWHWPIIVFTTYYLDRALSPVNTAAVIAASFAAAVLSWRFIEQPFRDPARIGRTRLFAYATVAAAAVVAMSLGARSLRGWPQRFSPEVNRLEAMRDAVSPRRVECHQGDGHRIPPSQTCTYGAAVAPQYAVWSDSHGVELSAALGEILAPRHESVRQFSYSSCPPAIGLDVPEQRACQAFNAETAAYLTAQPEIQTVFLIAYMDSKFERDPKFIDGLTASIRALSQAGKHVVLMYPVPAQPNAVPLSLAKYEAFGLDKSQLGTPLSAFLNRNQNVLRGLDRIAAQSLERIKPADALCPSGLCRAYRNGQALYFDRHHLSMAGARLVAPILLRKQS